MCIFTLKMQRLFEISIEKLKRTPMRFFRFLIDEIIWEDRLIGISGARGSGKTTLMLQYMKKLKYEPETALYVSLDDVYFAEKKLIYFAEDFVKNGGKYLFLDEVHKYPDWSRELKNIYDNLTDVKVVFTSSSALDIFKGGFDLSRRAMVYHLPGLSFREFINLKLNKQIESISLQHILDNKIDEIGSALGNEKPLPLFKNYIEYGYFPFYIEHIQNYKERLLATVNLVIETDLPSIFHIDYYSVQKIRRLLAILARIAPYKPNIQKLAEQTGTTRDTLLKYLFYLEKARILKWLGKDAFGINYLNKPEKLYLDNTNLMYALSDSTPDKGSLRENFFFNQVSVKHAVSYSDVVDFKVDEKYLFEIGGNTKTKKQIVGLENAFIAADNIEYPYREMIPLWLFGFLY